MPDILALFQDRESKRQEQIAAEATLANATAAFEASDAALAAALPEGVTFATTIDHPPAIQNVGGRIQLVRHPFLGDPYPATA